MSPFSIVIIILIIVLFVIIWKYLISDPYTLQSTQNGQTASTIAASSLATNGSSVPSSNFAYSIWFYINDWNYRYGEPKVVFGRMGAKSSTGSGSISGISGVDPCPAVILGAVENNVMVSVACYPGANQEPTSTTSTSSSSTSSSTTSSTSSSTTANTIVHTCGVTNIPIQKWVNLVISVYGRSMDIYIDGKLVRTCLLPGVASINNNSDIYVTPAGGFDGWTSKFQYYPNSLNPQEVWNIYSKGYGSWTSVLSSYQLQFALIENGQTQSSITI
jgi:hypothetical protein